MTHQTKYLHTNNEKLMIWKTKFTSLKQYLFGLVFSSSTKRTRTYQSILQVFNPVLKEMFHKSSKAAATKNFFPSMYMLLIKLASINVFHPITGKHYFFIQIHRFLRFFATTQCCCVFWNKCFERIPYFIIVHCVKSVGIRNYSGPSFPAFGMNTERFSIITLQCCQCQRSKIKVLLLNFS